MKKGKRLVWNGTILEQLSIGRPFGYGVSLALPRAMALTILFRLNAPWSDVPTAEVKQWLYWFIFNARMPSEEELSLEHRQVLQEALELMEKRAGGRVPEGSNPSLRSLRLTIDPFVITHRPLAWYVYVKVVNSYVFWQCKRKYGLRRGRFGKLE